MLTHVRFQELLDSFATIFLQRAARPLVDETNGQQWVAVADGLLESGVDCTQPGSPCGELTKAFKDLGSLPVTKNLGVQSSALFLLIKAVFLSWVLAPQMA